MWTAKTRGRISAIAKKTKRYPSDLTDEGWDRIAPLMPVPGRTGRPREVEFREVINAIRYLVRSDCGWRMLPVHFGHWRNVYDWFQFAAGDCSQAPRPRSGAWGGVGRPCDCWA